MDLTAYGLRPQRPEVIDSSMLKDYVDCPSMFYLRHVLGLRRKLVDPQRQSPLDWGTVWHRVMEAWYTTFDPAAALAALEPWPPTIMAETDSQGRSQQRMAKIFFDYIEKFGDADQRDFDILRTEQFFDVLDPNSDLRWCGRIDGIWRRKRNGRLNLIDHKTTGKMGSYYFEQFEHSFQIPGYAWAGSQLITEPLEDVMINCLYTLKGSHEFFRRTIRFTPARIAEWRANVLMWLEELNRMLDEHLHEPELWRKNWNECTRYGLCSFADVHFLPATGDTRLRVLSNDFIEDRWDPRRLDEGV